MKKGVNVRINPGYAFIFVAVTLVAGVGLGSFIKNIPNVLIVHCPDGFEIEIHGEFDLKAGHRMRLVFCEQQEYNVDSSDPLNDG